MNEESYKTESNPNEASAETDDPCTESNLKVEIPKERPKFLIKEDDDIEEFDTDSEESKDASEVKQDNISQKNYTDYITYEGEKCIYNEPGTGRKLEWSSEKNQWCESQISAEVSQNASDMSKNYYFDGKNYVYTDENSKTTYKYDQEKNEWLLKDQSNPIDNEKAESSNASTEGKDLPEPNKAEGLYGFKNDTHTYTDPSDGMTYIWNEEKRAWYPDVDEDFMARYQMSYGFVDPNSSSTVPKNPPKPVAPKKLTKEEKKVENKRKNQEPPSWFDIDETHNTTVYVTGLPSDVTQEELTELFTKCGLLARDEKGQDKIKIYLDSNGEIKGDARCTYIKVESVELALSILDGWNLRGHTLNVQRAKFQLKGDYDPSKKPKKKKNYKERQKKIHEKLLDWRPDKLKGEPLKCERVVVLKNLFTPDDFDKEVALILDYQQDIRSECTKCGEVKKVTIFDRNPEGVAQITFKEPEEAQACIRLLNGRWFGQRKISAEIWDGKTKYKIRETDEEIEKRLDKWEKFLDGEDTKKETEKQNSEESDKKETEAVNIVKSESTE